MMLTPGLLLLFVFFSIPMLALMGISLFKYDQRNMYLPILTMDNYFKFFSDFYFSSMIWNSLKIGFFTTLACIGIGYPIAYYLANSKGIERTIISAICLLPIFVTMLVTTLGWYIVLLPNGVTQMVLFKLGLINGPLKWIKTYPALITVLLHTLVPYVILILASSIENVSLDRVNAAKILGASTYQIFKRIFIPLTMPGIVSSGILTFSLAISSYLVPILITGQELNFLPLAVYSYTYELMNWPFASAIAIIMLTMVLIGGYLFTVMTNRLMRRGKWEEV